MLPLAIVSTFGLIISQICLNFFFALVILAMICVELYHFWHLDGGANGWGANGGRQMTGGKRLGGF